jgi:hypothetical protein
VGRSLALSIHIHITVVAHEPYMTNLPSRVMEPEAMELSRITFACPSWWLSNSVGTRKNQQIGQVCVKRRKHLPGQCSFHCTKPDSSVEKTAVHALLHEDYEDCCR